MSVNDGEWGENRWISVNNCWKNKKTLDKTESELQAARRIYNLDVTKYNTRINMFPFNMFAKMFGFKEETLFQAENDARVDVKF